MYRFPAASTAMPNGSSSLDDLAGRPLAEEPAAPVPATDVRCPALTDTP